MPPSTALQPMQHLGPALAALVFVASMSWVREPMRRRLNLALVAGAGGAYISGGGFGPWEIVYPVLSTALVYRALTVEPMAAYRLIGVGWLMHAAWDLLHHRFGNDIWPFMPTSSWGCMIFDSLIALWFLTGAPSPWRRHGAAAMT